MEGDGKGKPPSSNKDFLSMLRESQQAEPSPAPDTAPRQEPTDDANANSLTDSENNDLTVRVRNHRENAGKSTPLSDLFASGGAGQLSSKTTDTKPSGTDLEMPTLEAPDRAVPASKAPFGLAARTSESPPKDLKSLVRKMRTQNKGVEALTGKKVSIGDLVGTGKYESEAETHILKALEEKQAAGKQPDPMDSILSGVPEEMAHDFSPESAADEANADASASQGVPATPPTGKSRWAKLKAQRQTLVEQEREKQPESSQPKTPKSHHRTMSIEERLQRYTLAMWDEHDQDVKDDGPAGHVDPMTALQNHMDPHYSPRPRRDTASSFAEAGDDKKAGDGNNSLGDVENQQNSEGNLNDSSRPGNGGSSSGRTYGNGALTWKEKMEIWNDFIRPRRGPMIKHFRRLLMFIVIPFTLTAGLLYYFFDNPPTGKDDAENPPSSASASWWLLYVAVVIDFLCVGTKVALRFLGPTLTLLVVQSKGWPFVLFIWSILNFGVLYGSNPFASHWGYFQDWIGLLNTDNPSGDIVDSEWNRRVLLSAMLVSLSVTVKRFVLGLLLGKQTFYHYGEQLALLMRKMMLIGEVATVARRIQKAHVGLDMGIVESATLYSTLQNDIVAVRNYDIMENHGDDGESTKNVSGKVSGETLGSSEKEKLMQMVEQWEEPDRASSSMSTEASITAILKFRNALTMIKDYYPFSYFFGLADTRENCIESSQRVFQQLALETPNNNDIIRIETLGLVTLEDGSIDEEKAKELIKIFRPDRSGELSLIDFVKSIDAVYKEFRMLQASIENSSEIDRAVENIVNLIFYVVVASVTMSVLGFSIIVAFAFMIGSASAKYFEGVLFILGRRPYGIGDIIHVSNVQGETNNRGSTGWLVQRVTLLETTFSWLSTNETASVSNSSLATSRIINWTRSPHPRFALSFSVPIETKYETLELFKDTVREYIKARPREWLSFGAMRINDIYAEKGYMNVVAIVQHRDSWQNVGTIMDSRGNLNSFCLEVQRMLGMQYRAPVVPIELTNSGSEPRNLTIPPTDNATSTAGEDDNNEMVPLLGGDTVADVDRNAELFQSISKARNVLKS
eukprot:Nitzschia sp. Nitz4//scaffold41_size133979//57505//61267//NITZ4_003347-RA/size133979-processed-gene-0.249-mRNA-1//-1//CDS//3329551470//1371//frame0